MRSPFSARSAASICLFLLGSNALAESQGPVRDFNLDVRPILSQKCFSCHGQDEEGREADLRLDLRDDATAELDSGTTAIVPGEPENSELYVRIVSDDEFERMPPEDAGEALTPDEIALLRDWIRQGAPYAQHWSFVPPRRAALPAVSQSDWPRDELDHFILSRLEREGLQPSAAASRHALIRRLSLDLRGLPPSIEEVEQFVQDPRADAYSRLVDRFLSEPAFGERWARVWLDLARYADSRGYGSDPLRPNMWRYRDWVIDAFNRNLPYDQFTQEQLAGDLLPEPSLEQRMATAFHRNTMTNTEGGTDDEEFRVAAVKDRAETTIRVWMGLTMQCANCHEHKYDPIGHREYYALYAIFNQTVDTDRPDEFPTLEAPTPLIREQGQRIDQEITQRDARIRDLQEQLRTLRETTPPTALTGQYVRVEVPGKKKFLSLAEVQVFAGEQNLAPRGKATQSTTAYDGPAERAIDGNTDGHYFDAMSTTHTEQQDEPWWEVDLGSPQTVDRLVVWNRSDGNTSSRMANFRISLLDAERKAVWREDVGPYPDPSREFRTYVPHPLEKQVLAIQDEITAFRKSRPKMPTLPVLQELPADKQRETFVMIRGNFLSSGDPVEADFPQGFFEPSEELPRNRLGAARWLTDERNPLTARVAVNRLWANLFGIGLVETEEDFGTQGDLPSHGALLDWLAVEYRQNGWDTKQLLRRLVRSATYRQSSRATPDRLAKDPRNRLLSRGPRYRLEAEMVRDQALALGGRLSRKMHGPSVYPYQPSGLWRAAFNGQRTWPMSQGEDAFRRGLYTFWRRTVPYPSMQTFDAPSRELCTLRRIRTNTPLQAFVTLNDPVFVEAARGLAQRIQSEGGSTAADRAAYGLRLCLARPPQPIQVESLVQLYETERDHFSEDVEAARQLAVGAEETADDGHLAEQAAWTVVANVLLNLDGVLTKG